ncbi:MAK10-like protein [Tanacetum coccineum]
MENANPTPTLDTHVLLTTLRVKVIQELDELQAILAYIDSLLKNIEHLLNGFENPPNEIDMDDLEPIDESVDTPLVFPFLDLDDDSDDGEALNELEEYVNAGKLCRKKVINGIDGDDLAFPCMIGFRKFVAYFDPFLPMNIITRKDYNTIMVEGLKSMGRNLVAIVRDVYEFFGSFTYVTEFVVLEDIGEFIISDMAEVVMAIPFRNVTQIEYDYVNGNNVVPLRSDTIRLVQNGCSFHGLRSQDPNQHLKDFLKLVDLLDLDVANRQRTRLRLFQFYLRGQAINWLERLPVGSISTLEDLTTRFLAQFFPPRRTAKSRNDILMFQQHQGESLSQAWTRFKDLPQKVPHHGIDLCLQVQIFYDYVNPVTRRTIDQSAGGKLRDRNAKESWALLEDLALYDIESWNDLRDFAKLVKEISLLQDVLSTSGRHLIKLKNQVQRLMEAHLAHKQPIQVNKITSSCEICSGPQDTQYCMENPEQDFID